MTSIQIKEISEGNFLNSLPSKETISDVITNIVLPIIMILTPLIVSICLGCRWATGPHPLAGILYTMIPGATVTSFIGYHFFKNVHGDSDWEWRDRSLPKS